MDYISDFWFVEKLRYLNEHSEYLESEFQRIRMQVMKNLKGIRHTTESLSVTDRFPISTYIYPKRWHEQIALC